MTSDGSRAGALFDPLQRSRSYDRKSIFDPFSSPRLGSNTRKYPKDSFLIHLELIEEDFFTSWFMVHCQWNISTKTLSGSKIDSRLLNLYLGLVTEFFLLFVRSKPSEMRRQFYWLTVKWIVWDYFRLLSVIFRIFSVIFR